MDTGHGNVNWLVNSGSEVPNGSYGRSAYIALDESSEDGNTASYNSYFAEGTPTPNKQGVKCDTLEELAEKMGVDAAKFAATIARYNELAHNGKDEDFGKRATDSSRLRRSVLRIPHYELQHSGDPRRP